MTMCPVLFHAWAGRVADNASAKTAVMVATVDQVFVLLVSM
jgi:hypothetical protein